MFLYKINVLNISQNEFELPTFHRLPVPSHSLPPILLFFILLLVFIDGVLKEVECFCQFVELVLDILDLLRYAVVLVVVVVVVARCRSLLLRLYLLVAARLCLCDCVLTLINCKVDGQLECYMA